MRNPEATRFLSRLFAFVPLVGVLILIDWLCAQPPVRRLLARSLDDAGAALSAGNTIWSTVDPADLKPVWLEHTRTNPEIVVLGSSRAAQIPQSWFGQRSLLNAAIFAGDLLDDVAMFEKCLESGKTPRLVFLELSPALKFEDKARVSPALAVPFRHALLHYRIFPPALFTGPLTLDTVRWDPNLFVQKQPWRVSDKYAVGGYLTHPDGTMEWETTVRRDPPDAAERVALESMHNPDPKVQHWRTNSHPEWLDLRVLRAFLDDLHARGIRVVTLLVPVHPTAYDFYHRQGGYDDRWIRKEMSDRGISVVGAYSPAEAKAGREDFFDDVHVHPEFLHRLLEEGGLAE